MASLGTLNPHIQDLVSRMELASENLSPGKKDHAPTLTLYEKQKLLNATKDLTAKLEGSETAIWKIVFGVHTFIFIAVS